MRVSDLVGMRQIDLNVDIGEGFPWDEGLLEFATSANVSCGVHAGSEQLSLDTVELCRSKGVRVGAHPGYPDREFMGRRPMAPGQEREYLDSIFRQTRWFVRYADPAYVKPHGAFYNDTAVLLPEGWDDPKPGMPSYDAGGLYLARTPGLQSLTMILRVHRLPLMGLEATAHGEAARRAKQLLIREGFADRRLRDDGTLVPRSEPGAVLEEPDQIRNQVKRLAPFVDSICLHGDTPGCLDFAELVRKTLLDEGFEVGFE
ncbi:MAG TPA: 5-oxoprolinase subunit PxpA [Fimbriimonas sp.]